MIIAGDVFDVSNPSAASQSMYYQFIYRVTVENPNLQIVIVAGNHDSAARLEAPLPLLQAMRTEVRGVVRKLEGGEIDYDHLIVELKNRKGKWNCFAWLSLFARGIIRSCRRKATCTRREFANYIRSFCKGYGSKGQRISRFLPSVICRLQDREIAEKDYSERTVIGGLECVSPEAFSEQIAYTALGHIHKAQRVSGRENVRYAGSPIPMSFAEKHYHHGVVMVTF